MGLLSVLCEPSAPTKSLGIIWFNPSKEKDATADAWLVFLFKLTSGHTKITSLLDQAKLHVTFGPQSTENSLVTGYFRACHMHESTDDTLSRLSKGFSGHSDVHHTVGQTVTQNNQDTKCPQCDKGDAEGMQLKSASGEGRVQWTPRCGIHRDVNLTDPWRKAEPDALPKQEFQGLWGVLCGNKSWEEHKRPHRKTIEKNLPWCRAELSWAEPSSSLHRHPVPWRLDICPWQHFVPFSCVLREVCQL